MSVSVKLSAVQTKAIVKMNEITGVASSYDLGVGLNTLEALQKKGLVNSRGGVGEMFSPHTAIKWWLTKKGKDFLKDKS